MESESNGDDVRLHLTARAAQLVEDCSREAERERRAERPEVAARPRRARARRGSTIEIVAGQWTDAAQVSRWWVPAVAVWAVGLLIGSLIVSVLFVHVVQRERAVAADLRAVAAEAQAVAAQETSNRERWEHLTRQQQAYNERLTEREFQIQALREKWIRDVKVAIANEAALESALRLRVLADEFDDESLTQEQRTALFMNKVDEVIELFRRQTPAEE